MESMEALAQKFKATAQKPCLLCGCQPAGGFGIWIPDKGVHQQIVGAPKGRPRWAVYPICLTCISHPQLTEKVSAKVCQILLAKA